MSRPLYYPSSGYFAVTPDYENERLIFSPVVAFYPEEYEDAGTFTMVRVEGGNPECIQRPDGWLIDQQGRVGDVAATIERARNGPPRRPGRQRWLHRMLTTALGTDAAGRIYFSCD